MNQCQPNKKRKLAPADRPAPKKQRLLRCSTNVPIKMKPLPFEVKNNTALRFADAEKMFKDVKFDPLYRYKRLPSTVEELREVNRRDRACVKREVPALPKDMWRLIAEMLWAGVTEDGQYWKAVILFHGAQTFMEDEELDAFKYTVIDMFRPMNCNRVCRMLRDIVKDITKPKSDEK